MNATTKNYKNKCKRRYVDFYIKDERLYNYSKLINFSKLVKDALRQDEQQTLKELTTKEGVNNG